MEQVNRFRRVTSPHRSPLETAEIPTSNFGGSSAIRGYGSIYLVVGKPAIQTVRQTRWRRHHRIAPDQSVRSPLHRFDHRCQRVPQLSPWAHCAFATPKMKSRSPSTRPSIWRSRRKIDTGDLLLVSSGRGHNALRSKSEFAASRSVSRTGRRPGA